MGRGAPPAHSGTCTAHAPPEHVLPVRAAHMRRSITCFRENAPSPKEAGPELPLRTDWWEKEPTRGGGEEMGERKERQTKVKVNKGRKKRKGKEIKRKVKPD